MKKLLLLLTFYSAVLFAENESDCPFAARKIANKAVDTSNLVKLQQIKIEELRKLMI